MFRGRSTVRENEKSFETDGIVPNFNYGHDRVILCVFQKLK